MRYFYNRQANEQAIYTDLTISYFAMTFWTRVHVYKQLLKLSLFAKMLTNTVNCSICSHFVWCEYQCILLIWLFMMGRYHWVRYCETTVVDSDHVSSQPSSYGSSFSGTIRLYYKKMKFCICTVSFFSLSFFTIITISDCFCCRDGSSRCGNWRRETYR